MIDGDRELESGVPRQPSLLIGHANCNGRLGDLGDDGTRAPTGLQANLPTSRPPAYRTVIPDLLVYILAAMFIDASSWKSNLAAYGMCTCEILVLFLQGRHSNVFFLRFLT